MATKESKKREEVKKEIIHKTREIVSRLGYKKSSTEAIAKSLNRTKAALYHYFENREDIIRAMLEYEGQQVKNAIEEAVAKQDDPRKQLEAFFITRAKKIHELGVYYKSVIDEYFNRYPFIMAALEAYMEEEHNLIEKILREGAERNVFTFNDIGLTSSALLKSLKGFDFLMFQGEQFKKIQEELTETLNIFIKGISKK